MAPKTQQQDSSDCTDTASETNDSGVIDNSTTTIFGSMYSNNTSFSGLANGFNFTNNTTSASTEDNVRLVAIDSDDDSIFSDDSDNVSGGNAEGGFGDHVTPLTGLFGATTVSDPIVSSPWPDLPGGQQAPSIITGFSGFSSSGQEPNQATGLSEPEGQQVSVITGFEDFASRSVPAVGSMEREYHPTNRTDHTNNMTMVMHAITAMPFYENRSFEELRLEDYMAGNTGQGQPAPEGFLSPPGSGTSGWQYHPTSGPDRDGYNVTLHAITAMSYYENKSFEELRYEDYMAGNRGTAGQTSQSPIKGINKPTPTKPADSSLLDTASLEKSIKGKSIEELEKIEKSLTESLNVVKQEKEKVINRRLHDEEQKNFCVICLSEPKCVLLMPCQHLCVCKECSARSELNKCPLCRKHVYQKMDVYF